MSTHQETGHGPALSMAEAIANGNSANGDVFGINGGTNGSVIGGINGFANGEANDSGIPATNGYGHGSRDQHVSGKGEALEEPAESFASKETFDQASYEPIAIIGCGMRLPGAIDTDEALWQLLSGKQDGRCRVPLDRYNVDAFYGPGKAGHVCTEFGHFLEHVNLAEIDSSFWSMTRKEIEVMDPQQRLALEVVYECLQSSGTTDWKGKDIGVFFGIYGEDWADMQAKESQQSGMYRITGYGDFVVANRVSYEFGFKGPSVVTRTACSSSLTALHDACLAVQRGESESAIAGGTNLIMNPHMTIAMAEQGVLSVDGACKTFDSAANGYVRGEGVVAVHVKSLSAAIRDNDPIRAIIRSSCTNSDGRTAGLALPNSESHEALIRRSHKLADLDVRDTAMIECHGTGTQVGDPLEASAVARVFGDYGIYIGSIKPNLGHSEGASGITSVIKAMISLEKRLILPNINFHNPNKKIPFDKYDISVPTDTLQWPSGKAERIGVNSFGIGGANAHVLLESPTEHGLARPEPSDQTLQSHRLLTFSAASAEALENTVKAHEAYYQQHLDRLADLSYTLTVRRQPLEHRSFCVIPTGTEPGTPLQVSPFESSGEARLATFVFTGQGAQYAQMAADLLRTNGVFQASVDSMEKILAECNHPPTWSLQEKLLKTPKETNLALAEYSQPCCTAVQVALVDVLRSWGLEPTAVVGYSSGEIGAAVTKYASGVLSAADAIKVAYYRGIVSKNIETDGGMAANSTSSVTLSGDSDTLQEVMASIREQYPEALVRKLRVDCAYHSHHMKPDSSTYAELLSSVEAKRPSIPFYSSVTGDKVDAAALDASYWVSNLLSPVLFHPAVSRLLSDLPDAVLLEIGPHSALAGPLRQTIKATNSAKAEYVSTLVRDKNASAAMLSSMGSLFQRGVPVHFERVVPKGNVLTDLPRYAWHRQGPYWTESRLSQGWRQREFPKHDILGARVVEASEFDPTWRCLLKLDDVPWIRDHDISHDIVFPGAGFIG
ncbi:hypothetical protein V502_04560 [Pseudogymnoascus sp. VKM F-4520 (FW-2644)]|nr:hypothetical protein V502_04560 [Pseudogymnoascus sp. VKM F-4520 (FW-2644)]